MQTGARLIAEGVESDAERQMLQLLGVRLAQGFLFGRPAPIDQLASATGDPANLRRLPRLESGAALARMRLPNR